MRAYTIGNYAPNLLDNGPVQKVGAHEGYDGGIVFQTIEEAVAYRDEHYPTYGVWSLQLQSGFWEALTHQIEGEGFRRLIHDEPITGLVLPGQT